MSFWGLSPTGRNAQGRIPEIGNWDYGQMKDWYQKAGDFANKGNYNNDWATNYYGNVANGASPSADPRLNTQTGQTVMPGVQTALDNRWKNLNQISSDWSGVPKAADTVSQLNTNTDAMGGNITGNYSDVQGDINGVYGRNDQREGNVTGDQQKSIAGEYSGIGDNLNKDYGSMRKSTAGTYGGLQGDTGTTYSGAMDMLKAIQPGGQLQQAQVARSYAPETAATINRLRQAGVDINSPQAQQAINSVERDRARGMDEAAANSTNNFVNSSNNLALGKLANLQGLKLGNLNTQNELLGTQNALGSKYAQDSGTLSRMEQLRNLQASNTNDLARHGETTANTNRASDRTQNYLDQRNTNSMLGRNMSQQDFATQKGLLDQQNQEQLLDPQMLYQQYQAGFGQNAYNQSVQDQAAAKILGISQDQYNNMFRSGQMGQQSSRDAMDAYLKSLGIEGQNAGWGTKLLAGLAQGAMMAV